jgi:hypothetical protein
MSNEPIWRHQSLDVAAGKWLDAHPQFTPAGAWNAGIPGFFSHSRVVNLDGLVNDDIQPAIFANSVPCYLARNHLRSLVDQDCTGLADSALDRFPVAPYSAFTESVADFGRVEGERRCSVHVWSLDREGVAAACEAAKKTHAFNSSGSQAAISFDRR